MPAGTPERDPGAERKPHAGAVEYIVPAAEWDAENTEPCRCWDRAHERALGVYVLRPGSGNTTRRNSRNYNPTSPVREDGPRGGSDVWTLGC
jgi:hypothetical protein